MSAKNRLSESVLLDGTCCGPPRKDVQRWLTTNMNEHDKFSMLPLRLFNQDIPRETSHGINKPGHVSFQRTRWLINNRISLHQWKVSASDSLRWFFSLDDPSLTKWFDPWFVCKFCFVAIETNIYNLFKEWCIAGTNHKAGARAKWLTTISHNIWSEESWRRSNFPACLGPLFLRCGRKIQPVFGGKKQKKPT